jgi:molybdopterin biosynthesis enzyme
VKKTPTDSAVGKVLAYDTTLVTKTKSSTLLNRGHKITKKDVDLLKSSGVYTVWTDEDRGDLVYEWDISAEIAEKISDGTTDVVKGKHGIAFLVSKAPGIIRTEVKNMTMFNLNQKVLLITKKGGSAVGKGEIVAAIDVVPLAISKRQMRNISQIAKRGMIRVSPFEFYKVGLVITGTEIFEKRKKDQYFNIIKKKCRKYGWEIVYKEIVPDNEELETNAIKNARRTGAEGIIVTGGMSVDPTDRTPDAIRKVGAKVIAYGIPMKPTTMTIVSVWDGIPLFGISAGGIRYSEFNSIDLIFTRMMAGEIPSRKEIAELGDGGIFWNYDIH